MEITNKRNSVAGHKQCNVDTMQLHKLVILMLCG